MPIKFVCRTKKYEKQGGFSDHTKRTKPSPVKGDAMKVIGVPPTEEKYIVKPEDYASLALVHFGEEHEDLKV